VLGEKQGSHVEGSGLSWGQDKEMRPEQDWGLGGSFQKNSAGHFICIYSFGLHLKTEPSEVSINISSIFQMKKLRN
jgi:hypothetical protein